ncbi:MAG TPA: isoprenylcysteine carboxylmethyltransferase family protein [Candidatus Acidoferrales bacterium]|nr:isoprenylcysteine carboxylmethyltransferase family protein [Candidatus Acidoferrales bacterium]
MVEFEEEVMIDFGAGNVIEAAWIVFAAYWLISALQVKRKMKREPAGEQLARFLVLGAAFALLYSGDPRVGFLNDRFLPYRDWIRALGAGLTVAGVAFAIWARYHIGRYWSGSVSLKADHKLIRTGPYAHIRHPIYTGILLALAGTTLAIGRYRALVALAIWFAGFTWKARREEALLSGEFGAAFEEHKRVTGFFLPRFS